MSISIKARKAKGRQLQQWICTKIADIFKIEYNQQDDLCPIHSREMGQSGTDIILRDNMYIKFPFDIECKRTEKLNLYESIEQAKVNSDDYTRDWLLIHKKNHTDPIVIMSWDAFEKLIKKGQIND